MKITLSEFEASLGEVTFPLAVATSGGSDSLALLLLAHQAAHQRGGKVIALTVDHGLRPASKNEAFQVRQWVQEQGIEHVTLTWEGPKPLSRLQERAREARYDLLLAWCKNNHISTLLFGHHQQDQEETFWLRLASGSGLDGLSGMKKKVMRGGVVLLRPLLRFPKERLKATLIAVDQTWVEDSSNQSLQFFRGRFRTFLEEEGLSQQRLLHSMEKLQLDRDFIQESLHSALKTTVKVHEEGYISLHRNSFETLHPALTQRLLPFLMQWFSEKKYPPRSALIRGVLEKLKGSSSFTAGGIYWVPQREDVLLLREISVLPEKMPLSSLQEPVLWDHRFWIDPRLKDHVPEGTILAPLGLAHGLKKEIHSSIPSCVWPTLPAFWIKGKVASIPHFCYPHSYEMDYRTFFYLKSLFHDSLRFTI